MVGTGTGVELWPGFDDGVGVGQRLLEPLGFGVMERITGPVLVEQPVGVGLVVGVGAGLLMTIGSDWADSETGGLTQPTLTDDVKVPACGKVARSSGVTWSRWAGVSPNS